MTVGEAIIVILTALTVIYIGGYVVKTLWKIGGRNEFEEYKDMKDEFEELRKNMFD